MQKIVINSGIGGFGLSKEATKLLVELGSGYIKSESYEEYYQREKEEYRDIFKNKKITPDEMIQFHLDNLGAIVIDGMLYTSEYYWLSKDFNKKSGPQNRWQCRADPILVQVVEELGEKASGESANLIIVEIPDEVKWLIMSDETGWEWVAEEHRTWNE